MYGSVSEKMGFGIVQILYMDEHFHSFLKHGEFSMKILVLYRQLQLMLNEDNILRHEAIDFFSPY